MHRAVPRLLRLLVRPGEFWPGMHSVTTCVCVRVWCKRVRARACVVKVRVRACVCGVSTCARVRACGRGGWRPRAERRGSGQGGVGAGARGVERVGA